VQSSSNVIPNFLIIGAQKSGTTSLYYYLNQHPEIFMVPDKELHYFTYLDDENHKYYLTEVQYIRQFHNGRNFLAVGEASPSYLYSEKAPARIKDINPEMRLIAILRNPVERAYSNFLHNRRRGKEPIEDFEKVIHLEEKRIKDGWDFSYHYVAKGFYFKQLSHYLDVFDKQQLKVVLLDDLRENSLGTICELFDFLQVDNNFAPDLSARHNTSGIAKNKYLGRSLAFLQSFSILNKLIKKVFPIEIREKLKTSIYKHPHMSEVARLTLEEVYREDVIQLQSLINRDLSNWLVPKKNHNSKKHPFTARNQN
jgi:hypothetical protein